jgi:ArsR family transcriptional regulator, lead/cadmium/zinc/bismuth-responsive transcriptional repressor
LSPRTPKRAAEPDSAVVLAGLFRGLGDPTRVRLLAALADAGERTVSGLVTDVGVAQPRVSSHLAVLRGQGLVASRQEHRARYYRIADARVLALVRTARDIVAGGATDAVPDRVAAREATPDAKGDAPAVATAPGLHVIFDLGGEECAIPVAHVLEVLPFAPPRRVPSPLPGFIGLRNVRDEVLGVHDLAEVLGHPGGAPRSLLVVADSSGRKCLLAVGAVRGVEQVEAQAAGRPEVRTAGAARIVAGSRGLLLVLDGDVLLAELLEPGG